MSKKFETIAVRKQMAKTQYREHSTPLYLTSSFTFEDAEQARALFADEIEGNIYTRFSNPNNNEFIEKMCLLEGTEDGIATASGMSAMFTSMAALLKSGDHILASRSIFGSTHQILTQIFNKWGIESSYASLTDRQSWEAGRKKNTKMIFLETPSNPALEIADLEWICQWAHSHGILVNVDNCFATPYLQNPTAWGADIVTHSATKFIDGQGRVIAGCILSSKEIMKDIRFFARHTGPSLSPFNSWILSKSLETLGVRMDRHSENALKIAEFLQQKSDIEKVIYPYLQSHPQCQLAKKQMKNGGGIVTFVLKDGLDRGRRFLNSLQMCSHSANLGDSRTIATHPASTTHSKLNDAERAQVGILPGLIRISAGLENADDIIADLESALHLSK
ncbi:MAG: aminotransferase class I/II-fold pyridoxal phosphate-dependent enzyme [Cytophagales bacterium]|nr:aminotransferase class I/II-fold pyridoxal phosphate-dependent enzyme [Cytophagales bacterium]